MKQELWPKYKAVMKKHGVKKIEQIVRTQLGKNNFETYMNDVEAVYAFSRLTPLVNTTNEKQKMLNADKEWQECIIFGDDEPQYRPFVEKYGKESLLKAVTHMLDNNCWLAPRGGNALQRHSAENYKGLNDIHNAMDYLVSNGIIKNTETPAAEPARVDPEEQDDIQFEVPPVSAAKSFEDARENIALLRQTMVDLQSILPSVEQSLLAGVDEVTAIKKDMEPRIAKLEKQSDDAIAANARLMAENTKLVKDLKCVSDKYDSLRLSKDAKQAELEKELVRVKGVCTDMRREQTAMEAELNKYKKACEQLKEASEQAALPKKKVLPESAVRALPLVGDKLISVLGPCLEKYGIYLDPRK